MWKNRHETKEPMEAGDRRRTSADARTTDRGARKNTDRDVPHQAEAGRPIEGTKMSMERIPTEQTEQICLFRWAAYESGAMPELRLMYHIPNEGKRTKMTGGILRMEGMKEGFPDIGLPVARGESHGLFIEMKRIQGKGPTEAQEKWMRDLSAQGYAVCWCRGWEAAAGVIKDYMQGKGIAYTPCKGRAGEWLAGRQE